MTTAAKIKTDLASFPVIGIGTSAGGLKALEDFFDHLPQGLCAAFVVIQPLSPNFKGLMRDLLGKHTTMQVEQVEDSVELRPNCIFLIPPGQSLTLQGNTLRLFARGRQSDHRAHFPIDTFFQSLSVARKNQAVGIVLSGTGSDGSKGLESIAQHGGTAMVQLPETAEFDGMPLSAIATGIADFVFCTKDLALATHQVVTAPTQPPSLQTSVPNKTQLATIISLLEQSENIDFTHYKPTTLKRQILRRCALSSSLSLDQYIQRLKHSVEEREALRDALLITVTYFLRDLEAWKYLKAEILPGILEKATKRGKVRIWVTACATGEEAYSIAILLRELMTARQQKQIEVKIFATDIDPIALGKAAKGIYGAKTMRSLTTEQVDRFFIRKGDTFEVSRSIREMVVFASHDLTKEAAFAKIDLVSCRNMLIYMQPVLQQQVLYTLLFSLRQQGILFLGKSENIGSLEEFTPVSSQWNLYQKNRNACPSTLNYLPAYQSTSKLTQRVMTTASSQPKFDPLIETAFTALLQDRQATCLLVDQDNRLLHVCSDALKMLRVAPGKASQSLLRILPQSLHLPLNAALHRAQLEDQKVYYKSCEIVETDYECRQVSIEVSKHQHQSAGHFLMVVIEAAASLQVPETSERSSSEQETTQYILQLRRELQASQETLRATVEELEITNEEQQATNEELTASNEEMQSTNEELHSVNEELYTVNSEYQSKIQELTQLNNDLDNLINSIDIGVIFLDRQLQIRKFTAAATLAFNLVESDIGRPLEHLAHNLEGVDITKALLQAALEEEVSSYQVKLKSDGSYLLMKIFPYTNERQSTDGLVLTLVNVDGMKRTQAQLSQAKEKLDAANKVLEKKVKERTLALRESQQLLQSITQSTPNGIYVYDLKTHQNIYANSFLERLLGYSAEQIQSLGSRLNEYLFHPEDLEKIAQHHQRILNSSEPDNHIFAIEYRIRDSEGNWHDFYSQDTVFKRDEAGKPWRIIGTAIDVSDRNAASLQLQESETRYRQLYQHAPVMMHSIDLTGNIISASDQWLIRLGYQEEEILNQPVANLLSDKFKPEANSSQIPVWMNEQGCELYECQFVCKNGNILDVQLSAVADKDADGRVQKLLTVLIDISERNQAEKEIDRYREHLEELVASRTNQLRDTNKKLTAEVAERIQAQSELDRRAKSLERSNADLEQFAYVVSHDLQEPIRAMTVFSQLLQQRYLNQLDDTGINYIVNIVEGGIRMQALIDGILEFSRVTHRGQQFVPVEIGPLVKTVLSGLSTTLVQHKVTVTVDDLPTVRADPNQISQLFQNLVSNAVKFKRDEPPTIHISATAQHDDRGVITQWLFGVQDNGIGISKDQQKRIFALFQRLHTRQELAGYGIGLAICKKIIERHSGHIWVDSAPNEGATFFFTLNV